CARKRVWFAYW
nr:immunoglobulin heavy chain junction region [Mus musculus]